MPSYGREGTPVNERDDFTCGGLGSAFTAPRVALQEPGVRLDPLRAIARSIHVRARVQSCEGFRGSIGKDSGGVLRAARVLVRQGMQRHDNFAVRDSAVGTPASRGWNACQREG